MKRNLLRAVLALVLFGCGILVGAYVNEWMYIESCFDSGGAWDYARYNCRYK